MTDRSVFRPDITPGLLNEKSPATCRASSGWKSSRWMQPASRAACRCGASCLRRTVLHAASVIALADTLCGYGCIAHLPEGARGFTTIELKRLALFRCTQMILWQVPGPRALARKAGIVLESQWRVSRMKRAYPMGFYFFGFYFFGFYGFPCRWRRE
jgi:hypothetical protein